MRRSGHFAGRHGTPRRILSERAGCVRVAVEVRRTGKVDLIGASIAGRREAPALSSGNLTCASTASVSGSIATITEAGAEAGSGQFRNAENPCPVQPGCQLTVFAMIVPSARASYCKPCCQVRNRRWAAPLSPARCRSRDLPLRRGSGRYDERAVGEHLPG
jgi:hypothetical protein